MTDEITGGCLCGAVRYAVNDAPRFAIKCYCRDCQQTTGTGHLPQIAMARAAFSVTGPVTRFERTSDAGHAQELGFCGTCGSPIYKMTSLGPEILFVTAGTLDQPDQAPPFKPVYEDGRLPWDES